MKKSYTFLIIILFLFLVGGIERANAQKPVTEMNKQELMELDFDQLLELSIEDLMYVANRFNLTSEELINFFLNKDVTIASKKSETSFDSPLSTSVITREEILQSGANTIAEAFRLIPGMIVREKTPGNFDVHIRGNDNVPPGNFMLYSENSLTLVMIDYRIVYSFAFGGTFWEAFPVGINDVDRIEVVRGPSSALYGANAVSGVINIITRKPENRLQKFDVYAQYGSMNSKMAEGSVSGGVKSIKYRISANYLNLQRFQESAYFFPAPLQGYYSVDYMGSPNDWNGGLPMKLKEGQSAADYIPDPTLGTNRYGGNAYLFFDPNDKISVTLSGGMQGSESLTSMLDDSNLALARRVNKTGYVDLTAKAYGFLLQTNANMGTFDITTGSNGFRFDQKIVTGRLEYDFSKIKNLNIIPSFHFNNALYSDEDYLRYNKFNLGDIPGFHYQKMDSTKESVIGGDQEVNYYAFGIRADYMAFNKLRLIAAVSNENYNAPKDDYLSYQFISSFKISDSHILRVLYSKANRSPFISDQHMNFNWWKRNPNPPMMANPATYYPGLELQFDGNEDLKLATQQLYELGYRGRITKNISLNLEVFYTKTENFAALMPDSVSMWTMATYPNFFVTQEGLDTVITPLDPTDVDGTPIPQYIHFSCENLEFSAVQKGISFDLDIALGKKLQASIFGTYQQNEFKNYNPLIADTMIANMVKSIVNNYYNTYYTSLQTTGVGVGELIAGDRGVTLITGKNKWTPSFYGGASMNYKPIEKLNLNLSSYFYTKQTYIHKFATTKVDPKMILNIKADYKFYKDNSVFFNVRNLLGAFGQDQVEFAFLDKIGTTVLLGLNLNF